MTKWDKFFLTWVAVILTVVALAFVTGTVAIILSIP